MTDDEILNNELFYKRVIAKISLINMSSLLLSFLLDCVVKKLAYVHPTTYIRQSYCIFPVELLNNCHFSTKKYCKIINC